MVQGVWTSGYAPFFNTVNRVDLRPSGPGSRPDRHVPPFVLVEGCKVKQLGAFQQQLPVLSLIRLHNISESVQILSVVRSVLGVVILIGRRRGGVVAMHDDDLREEKGEGETKE